MCTNAFWWCVSVIEEGKRRKEVRAFNHGTAGLLALRQWLLEEHCTHIGMERTGVYWMPVYRRLEGFFELVVANAQHIKAVPERKTDVKDAKWIADLLQQRLQRVRRLQTIPEWEKHYERRVGIVRNALPNNDNNILTNNKSCAKI